LENDTTTALINPQVYQLILTIIGGLLSIIGVIGMMLLRDVKKRLDDHDIIISDHTRMIEQTKSDIKANSKLDEVVMNMMDNKHKELKSDMSKMIDTINKRIDTLIRSNGSK